MYTIVSEVNVCIQLSVLSLKEKQQHKIGFPTFKLPASTRNLL